MTRLATSEFVIVKSGEVFILYAEYKDSETGQCLLEYSDLFTTCLAANKAGEALVKEELIHDSRDY